jgi:deazaflavin-dependent oxidoreductase (nitroreductase family)
MTRTQGPAPRAPLFVRVFNPLASRLLRIGFPMGPNMLLTVRGRMSGLPRSAPVAVAEIDGRRWVVGAYGDVNWVRNLRAAGEGDIALHGGGAEHVLARELDRAEAIAFFRDLRSRYVDRLPRLGRAFLELLFRAVAPDILGDPERAAERRPVFELRTAR